jgi:flagellar protein FlaI
VKLKGKIAGRLRKAKKEPRPMGKKPPKQKVTKKAEKPTLKVLEAGTELAELQGGLEEMEKIEVKAPKRRPVIKEKKVKVKKPEKIEKPKVKEKPKRGKVVPKPPVKRVKKLEGVSKPDLEALETDKELTELQEKLAAGEGVQGEFEDYTTFEVPTGYQEQGRYWIVKPFAWVAILFNPERNERLYYLVEPRLTPLEKTVLETLHEHLLDRLTYDEATKDRDVILATKAVELLDEYDISLDDGIIKKLLYYIKRSYIGFGRIDAFLKDPRIEDISCDGPGLPIFLYHQDYQNVRTNVVYDDPTELDLAVGRLVERAGKQISLGKPTVDATLPQGYRLQATIGKEVTTRGSTFTIRKYREEPFTPVDLIKFKTFSSEMLAYLWLAAENKKNIVIVGGTASGKTCTLNAISLFMPPDAKIVSIEDTRELSLYQDNWVAAVTRPAYGEKAITMYDLLAQALRQRPEIIIVGEVRGSEALSLFQAMTTGHTSYSTMHAGSVQEMVYRLEGEPINVPHHMLSSLNIMCLQLLTHFKDTRVRRNQSVVEIAGVDRETGALRTNHLFERNSITDRFEQVGNSLVMAEIMQERGWGTMRLDKELDNRRRVLEYLVAKNINGIEEVSKIIRQYHFEPEKVMKLVNRAKIA